MYKNVNCCIQCFCVFCVVFYNIMWNTLPILSLYFLLITILVFVTVLTIYLSYLVELFILCCSGASLLSFCTFIQFLFLFTIIIASCLNYCNIKMPLPHTDWPQCEICALVK